MSWKWPLRARPILPDEPGTFGSVRLEDVHTGVDLYCEMGTDVLAVEDGTVLYCEWFTGQHVATPSGEPAVWWNDTQVILIQGASGIVAYAEVDPYSIIVKAGDKVVAGQKIAAVREPVLKSFKGRPMVMLHLELYSEVTDTGTTWSPSHTVWWEKGKEKPTNLIDPTPHLMGASPNHETFDLTKYDGKTFINAEAPRKASRWWEVWGGEP